MPSHRHPRFLAAAAILAIGLCSVSLSIGQNLSAAEPVKILLITGGCCHDYDYQSKTIQEAFKQHKIDVEWKVVQEGGNGTEAEIKLYQDPKWADGFDVVIHNECFANTTSEEYIKQITEAHKNGVNGVVIHCAMHTYRAAEFDDWREFLGVTSRKHEHQSNYPVKVVERDHPIMKGFPNDWVTPKDELYIIETLWPNAKPLATSISEQTGSSNPCFWVNEYGKSRVFGTTYGHSNETFADKTFQQALVRGTLWAAGKLHD
ncbi:ThuA domain-containing protein [Aureliella helgolandensis]|uniref:Trehalose utilization n=1 Tax=Aureliella helgolandensis TaxID=2527968 RepID=A0A518GC95_9BACT|nr:ThuA domain-containing protein [Aureliella helgolandensis]QDV26226.1 Trehalose utilization [Aureliella helgolandensis]